MTLTQLGYADAWTSLWSRTHEPETLESYLVHLQQLLAQDSTLASETKAALLQDSQQHGPLVYRLICGFSKDQLTEETRLQLETLLQHPEPAIRCWTHFQLSQR